MSCVAVQTSRRESEPTGEEGAGGSPALLPALGLDVPVCKGKNILAKKHSNIFCFGVIVTFLQNYDHYMIWQHSGISQTFQLKLASTGAPG